MTSLKLIINLVLQVSSYWTVVSQFRMWALSFEHAPYEATQRGRGWEITTYKTAYSSLLRKCESEKYKMNRISCCKLLMVINDERTLLFCKPELQYSIFMFTKFLSKPSDVLRLVLMKHYSDQQNVTPFVLYLTYINWGGISKYRKH